MIKVSPSILSANFADMKSEIEKIERAGADYIHCDVMDGIFVPNITFGFQMIKDIRKITRLPMDVHLMIDKPERYIDRFCEAGGDIITVHAEATPHLHRAVQFIKNNGVKAGAVLNPGTSLDAIEYVLDDVDMILLMSVNPGYGGQKFIPKVLRKIEKLRKMIDESGRDIELEIDGGINEDTIDSVLEAGANVIVAGNAVFTSPDPKKTIDRLKGIK